MDSPYGSLLVLTSGLCSDWLAGWLAGLGAVQLQPPTHLAAAALRHTAACPHVGSHQRVHSQCNQALRCGYGFHEDGIRAAVAAVSAAGGAIPWECRTTSPKVRLPDIGRISCSISWLVLHATALQPVLYAMALQPILHATTLQPMLCSEESHQTAAKGRLSSCKTSHTWYRKTM
jgi:hypothetical protein